MVCKNGHGYGETTPLESCPYCNAKLNLREYTPEDIEKTKIWYKEFQDAKNRVIKKVVVDNKLEKISAYPVFPPDRIKFMRRVTKE